MSEKRKVAPILLKGIAMGMADVVPGVSGGTVAFITGIYEELITSIGKFDAKALKVLTRSGFVAFFKHVNGAFLLPLFVGIGLSLVTLARLVTYLLTTYPVLIWSFFFGLILASAVYIGRQVKWTGVLRYFCLVAGAGVAYAISLSSPSGADASLIYVFFSGAIAICAMILPGISGSFILLLLGSYATVFGALGHLADDFSNQAPIVLAFGAGALIGLLSFAKLLNYLFASHRGLTISVLTGFMLGSLAKVWPWKETISIRINSKGEEVPLEQINISPDAFLTTHPGAPALHWAILAALLGMVLVFLLSRVDVKKVTKS